MKNMRLSEVNSRGVNQRPESPKGLGVDCDECCGTELINPTPDIILPSKPPRIRTKCPKCGATGTMPLRVAKRLQAARRNATAKDSAVESKSWGDALADGSFAQALREGSAKFKDANKTFALTPEEQEIVYDAVGTFIIVMAAKPGSLSEQMRGAKLKTTNRLYKRLKKALGQR